MIAFLEILIHTIIMYFTYIIVSEKLKASDREANIQQKLAVISHRAQDHKGSMINTKALDKWYREFSDKILQRIRLRKLNLAILKCGPNFNMGYYILINLALWGLLSFLLFWTKRASLHISIYLGCALSIMATYQIVLYLGHLYKVKFLRLFPGVLETIMRGLQAGVPIQNVIEVIAQKSKDPVRSIFNNLSSQIKLGFPIAIVFKDMSKKVFIEEFKFFALVISIQQETGGSLTEILSDITDLIRQRQSIVLRLKALASETKISAIIISLLPIIFALLISFVSPEHLMVFVETEYGDILLNIAITLMSTGIFILWRMSNIRI